MSDLYAEKPQRRPERKIVATYDYVDENGALIFQVVRYEPKSFAQRRPDGKGGWLYNLDGVQRVLYRLPDVLKAKERGETIFITEGEKDTESLRALGLTATTNPHGANKWRDEYSETLRGAHVVIIPDKDEPGRRHAEQIAKSLYGKAASVKIAELPGAGKDVSDWLAAGYTREDLESLVAEAPEFEPEEPEPAPVSDFEVCDDSVDTDLANAERLAALHKGRALHVPAWGWLTWDGKRWVRDETGEISRLAIETVKSIYREASRCDDPQKRKKLADWARRSESRQRIEAMIALAGPLLAARPDQFDRDPYLLNVLNGTLDLRTMRIREHRPEDFITKIAPVEFDPAAKAPLWEAFLERIFAGNRELIEFIQRAVGYALTGDTKEQCLFILWGTGANGKSTFVTTIQSVLGDYALQTPTETLLAKRHDAIPNDVARLKGARFVSAIESSEGRRINEALVKQLTGGDRICARYLHREFFEFTPECKLFIATNHKPVIHGTDYAIWRRIRLVPFTVTIPEHEQDKELPRKLLAEAPGILNWCLEGCLAWQRQGLGVPEAVRIATEQYRADMDTLAQFIADCCILDPNAKATAKELYEAYVDWCKENGEEPLSQRAFGRSLSERGLTPARFGRSRTRGWLGIGLAAEPPLPPADGADTSAENVRNADLNAKTSQARTFADANLGVFSGNFPYIGKKPENCVRICPQNEDFADGKRPADVFAPSVRGVEAAGGADDSDDDEIPF